MYRQPDVQGFVLLFDLLAPKVNETCFSLFGPSRRLVREGSRCCCCRWPVIVIMLTCKDMCDGSLKCKPDSDQMTFRVDVRWAHFLLLFRSYFSDSVSFLFVLTYNFEKLTVRMTFVYNDSVVLRS
jgi:hypothetical protein